MEAGTAIVTAVGLFVSGSVFGVAVTFFLLLVIDKMARSLPR